MLIYVAVGGSDCYKYCFEAFECTCLFKNVCSFTARKMLLPRLVFTSSLSSSLSISVTSSYTGVNTWNYKKNHRKRM